jgi:hypothetical protein
MSTVSEIKEAICQLTNEDRAALRAWLAEADATEWDRKFEADVGAGPLDWLLQEAREDLQARRAVRK